METKKCKNCGIGFLTNHGNKDYCSNKCYIDLKKRRQRKARDGIKSLLHVLHKNHAILDALWKAGIQEFSEKELELKGLDFSLCRHIKLDTKDSIARRLDFGEYFLITFDNFSNFKLYSNDTSTL